MILIQIGPDWQIAQWIMGCVTSASFVVLVNGSPSYFFQAGRGLRQGCPLSPLFFLLVVDSLSRLIEKAKLEGKLCGFFVSKGFPITHLMFVDDLFLLGSGNIEEWSYMNLVVDLFCKASSLEININKFVFIHINVDKTVLRAVNCWWGVGLSSLDYAFKYLGFFLKATSYRILDWHWLLKKFDLRINSWINRWLSMGGRLVLAKVVLQNLQVYWCTLAKLPSAINQRIKQLTANFLWRGERSPIGFHLSSWNFIAKPKAMGGWGLRDVELFNKYLAAKYLWRVLFHQGIWSRLMRKKYMKGVKVTKWLRKEMEGYSIASLLWRNLITASPIIKGWLAWEVGSGNQIHVGMDPFIGGGSFYKLSDPLLYRLHQTGHYTLTHVKRSYGRKWLTAEDIHLQNREAEEWSGFVAGLEWNAISLKDSSDRIV